MKNNKIELIISLALTVGGVYLSAYSMHHSNWYDNANAVIGWLFILVGVLKLIVIAVSSIMDED